MPGKALFLALACAASAAHGAHPLITEDTGTQGKGRWQLELFGERTRDRTEAGTARTTQTGTVLSYGFADNADLQVGLPYTRHAGRGDATLDVKWRFFEREALSLGLKPGITLATGRDERGLGSGRATAGTLFIVSWEPEGWALHSHAGHRHNRNTLGQRESLRHLSAALWLKPSEKLKLVFDLSADTNPDAASNTTVRQRVAGFIYSVSKDLDLDAGVRRGNAPAIDRALLFGVTLRW